MKQEQAEDDPLNITDSNESAIQMEVIADVYQHQQQTQQQSQRKRNIQSSQTRPCSSAERQRRYRERKKADKINALLREQQLQQQQMEDINAITVLSNTPHTSSVHQLQNVDQAVYERKRHLNKQRQRRFRARQRFASHSTSSHEAQAERREAWIEACDRTDLKMKTDHQLNNMRVCSLHFEKYMYIPGENQLKDLAIPTLKLPPSSAFSVYTQTDFEPNITTTHQGFQETSTKIKIEVTEANTDVEYGMPYPNESSAKRIKVENDIETGDYRLSGGESGIRQCPDVSLEQFLRGCELYLTPELRQYVRTQLINTTLTNDQQNYV